MKKTVVFCSLCLSLLLGSALFCSCASTKMSKSYNVNVFDDSGNWYETGLLIKSNDKVYIKLDEGQFELIQDEDERYTFEIKGKTMYVR